MASTARSVLKSLVYSLPNDKNDIRLTTDISSYILAQGGKRKGRLKAAHNKQVGQRSGARHREGPAARHFHLGNS
ncbi:hypothetical protein RRG08_036500 [Elysia crispata]|uniref:Uncharacterized protein n=1 Tax=Elysia crispata TaxID=231223 RepID=A0AAE0ZL42_9GAST|nr:hypothetical protein RRG08_036500 [Elysia crispata]